jgi:hypothetical protein
MTDDTSVAAADVAIAIVGYNRPAYFTQMLDGLAANPLPTTWRVFAFLDGGPQSTQADLTAIIKASPLAARIQIEPMPFNMGTGRNLIAARRMLFEDYGFERVMVLEEDCVIGPDYLAVCNNLMNWSQQTYDNVGAVSGWNMCFMDFEHKSLHAKHVGVSNSHWITYMMTRACWYRIRDMLHEYEARFLQPYASYKARPHVEIRKWIRNLVLKADGYRGGNSVPMGMPGGFDAVKYFDRDVFASGQDACTAAAIYCAGMVKLSTLVNRALYIGIDGEHGNRSNFDAAGFGRMTLDPIPGDATNTNFEVWTGSVTHAD